MANRINNNGEQEQDDGNPVNPVHHAQVDASRMIRVGLPKYTQEISENRPNLEIINESVHKK